MQLSTAQLAAIEGLVSGKPVQDVAQACGVNRVTIWRWMKEPLFIQEMNAVKSALRAETLARLHFEMHAAVDVISSVMNDTRAPAIARLRAVEIVLDRTAQAELEELQYRLSILEQGDTDDGDTSED